MLTRLGKLLASPATEGETQNFGILLIEVVRWIFVGIGALIIPIAIFFGFQLAYAQDEQKRRDVKKRLMNMLVSVIIIIFLIGLLSIPDIMGGFQSGPNPAHRVNIGRSGIGDPWRMATYSSSTQNPAVRVMLIEGTSMQIPFVVGPNDTPLASQNLQFNVGASLGLGGVIGLDHPSGATLTHNASETNTVWTIHAPATVQATRYVAILSQVRGPIPPGFEGDINTLPSHSFVTYVRIVTQAEWDANPPQGGGSQGGGQQPPDQNAPGGAWVQTNNGFPTGNANRPRSAFENAGITTGNLTVQSHTMGGSLRTPVNNVPFNRGGYGIRSNPREHLAATRRHTAVSSDFGWRPASSEVHGGIDINRSNGTRVNAVAYGIVVYRGSTASASGTTVVIQHGYGPTRHYTRHLYLRNVTVTVGQAVTPGTQLGDVGEGHLHFDVYLGAARNDRRIDPLTFSFN